MQYSSDSAFTGYSPGEFLRMVSFLHVVYPCGIAEILQILRC